MSLTLATVADALIEFILSLLRDPDAAAEFDADPEGVLAHRGLSHANASDVASVAPIIIERTQVVHVAKPVPVSVERDYHSNPVVREIKQVTSHVEWVNVDNSRTMVDDRDTIVDQSVNQNIWADGDVTQTFDNEAIVASGDDALAAGDDLELDQTSDQSTTIEAGGDANIGNDTDVTVIEDSYDEDTDASTVTDESTDITVVETGNDSSSDVAVDDSGNVIDTTVTDIDVALDETIVTEAEQVVVEETVPAETNEETIVAEPVATEPEYVDSALEYTETDIDADQVDAFESDMAITSSEGTGDDDL